MAALSNKNSFSRMHMPPLFCIKTNLRENRFFAGKWTVGGKKGTHNVKFSTENLTKIIILHARASGQRHRKDVRLQQSARAVVGDVAHDQPRRHHGKAEVICYRQAVFNLWRTYGTYFRQVAFWNIAMFYRRQMGQYFRFYRTFIQVLRTWMGSLFQF